MLKREALPISAPLCSVVVAVYNDWALLERCLQSLAGQLNAPEFEVVVVDDGSRNPAPESVLGWKKAYPLTLIRQQHQGIAAARNTGIQSARGSILVFVDADCKLQPDCLGALATTILHSPEHNCFQLRLTGDCSHLVGRAEELRLTALQKHLLRPDGRIRYLNTAGCAIRKSSVDADGSVFEPMALRSEDTLYLANLMQIGDLPLFVPSAVVQHAVALSLPGCLAKDIRSAYLDQRAHAIIATKGVALRATHRERLDMISSMWEASRRDSIGRLAWFVVVTRTTLMRVISALCSPLRWWSASPRREKFFA